MQYSIAEKIVFKKFQKKLKNLHAFIKLQIQVQGYVEQGNQNDCLIQFLILYKTVYFLTHLSDFFFGFKVSFVSF